ncbi:MauE/DoxX family redox-associated membrane protein [Nonomuraea sp. NPDC048826]|uniref:MauE/DoxX family redox-associated membrane protein n=1 Tax=Nonomuraea sp. NPDC048826 TaxID=3364347 RepID=UPI003713EA5E
MLAYVGFGCRVLLAVVFFAAAMSKVRGRRQRAEFQASLEAFGVRPRWRSPATAAVITGELATASLLAPDVTALAGLGVGAALLLVFTTAISSVLRRGVSASCRCFGASTQPLGRRHLIRNAILLLIAAVGVAGTLPATAPGLAAWDPAALALSGFAAMVLAALVISYDDLVAVVLPR